MKVKYLLLSLLACAGFAATSCTEEDPIFGGDEVSLKVDPSIILVGKDGGSKTIDINAAVEWKAEPKDSWITISPSSGSGAVQVTVTVAKNDDENARQSTVVVTAGPAKMNITVKQDAGGVVYGTAEHPYPASKIYEYVAGLDPDVPTEEFYIEGIIAKIDELFGAQYGNATFFITDDGKTADKMFEVFRTWYFNGAKWKEGDKQISLGDKVVVFGKCVNYKGNTPETVQDSKAGYAATLISLEAGTMPVLEMAEKSKAISAGDTTAEFDLTVKNLTAKWTVTPAEAYAWVKDYTKEGTESGKITITVDPNTADDAREAKFTVASEGAQSLEFVLTQGGNVLPATIAELKAGVAADVQAYANAVNFEANLKDGAIVTYVNGKTAYIEDATGAVCYYGSADITDVKAGDKISGKITGKAYWRYGTLQIDGLGTECTKGEATVTETEITLADLLEKYDENMARRVVIKGITVKTGASGYGKTAVITQGDKELNVYIQKDGVELTTDAEGDLIAYPGRYKEANQLLLWDNAWFSQTGGPVEVPEVYLNEFDCTNKKIEIYNATSAEVDMTGWKLIKDDGKEDKDIFVIPAALAKVPAKGFAVFTCKQADAANGPLFGLSGTKGFKIALMYDDKNQVDVVDNLTTIVTIEDGKSWGRETDGAENFVIFDTPTIGESNGTAPFVPDFTTVAELNALAASEAAEHVGTLTDAVVSFVPNSSNAIIKDATGSILLYKSGHGLKQGQTYTGEITVTITIYNDLPELTAISAAFAGDETAVAPEEISLATLAANFAKYASAYIKVANLTVTNVKDKYITVKDGETEYTVYTNPSNATNVVGDVITAVGTATKYKGAEQIKVWKMDDITVTQAGAATLDVSDVTGVPAAGVTDATVNVTIKNGDGWTASVTPDGTVVTAASIADAVVTYSVSENTGEAREGSIEVKLSKSGQDDVVKTIKVSQEAAGASTSGIKFSWTRSGNADNVTAGYEIVTNLKYDGTSGTYPSAKDGYYQDGGTVDTQINGITLQTKDRATALFTQVPTKVEATFSLGAGSAKDPLDHPVYACLVDADGKDIEATVVTVATALTKESKDYKVEFPVAGVATAYGVKVYHAKETSWNVRYYGIAAEIDDTPAGGGDNGSGIPDYDPITGFTW